MRSSLLLLMLALATSCTIMVNGKPVTIGRGNAGGGSDGTTAERGETPVEADPGGNPGAPGPGAHPDVVAFYQQASYENCCDGRGDEILVRSGFDTKTIRRGNPDPKWIPGWQADYYPMVLMSAMMQAAINRTWYAACYEDFDRTRAAWEPLEQEIRPKLERLRHSSDYYGSVDELRQLWAQVGAYAADHELDHPTQHPGRWSDLRLDILRTFVDLHQRLEDPFMPLLSDVAGDVDWESYKEKAELWTDPKDARDAYCVHAERYGTATLQKRQTMDRWESSDPNMVATPLPDSRKQQLNAAQAEFGQARAAELAKPESPKTDWVDDVVWGQPGEWVATHVLGSRQPVFVVRSIERKGASVELTVSFEKATLHSRNCRRTNRVAAILPDGRVEYEELCDTKKGRTTITVTATFDSLPDMIEVGDIVDFAGKSTKAQPDKRKGFKFHHRLWVDGVHLWTVVRDGQVLQQY